MRPSEERLPAARWRSPAGTDEEDMVAMNERTIAEEGQAQSPDPAYPQGSQAYAPAHGTPSSAGAPCTPAGQEYSPAEQAYSPAGQAQDPSERVYEPSGQAHDAPDQAYEPAAQAQEQYPPAGTRPAETQAWDETATGTAVPVREAPVTDPGGTGQAADTDRRWSEILAMFVDDPRASVEQASGLTDRAVETLVTSLRQRQTSLASGWQGSDTGTETLRGALREYRAFWAIIRNLAEAAAAGQPDATGSSPAPAGERPGAAGERPGVAGQQDAGRGRPPA